MLEESHSSRKCRVKPMLSKIPMTDTYIVEASSEARVPRGIGASPATPAHAITAGSLGTKCRAVKAKTEKAQRAGETPTDLKR